MTETAANIIAETQDEEGPSIEEEFRDLRAHMEGLVGRLNKIATTLEQSSEEPVTKKDLAGLYRFVAGDVVSSVNDLVAACGAAFNDVLEIVDSEEGDSEEGDDSGGPSEEDIQVYTTLKTDVEAFSNLAGAEGLSPEQKAAFEQMRELNQKCVDTFHEAYGESVMQEAAEKQVAEARGESE